MVRVHHVLVDIDDVDVIYLQPPPKSKGGKMLGLINWRLKVTINDGRALTGQMLAFDRHMNLVLADCEEFRRVRPKKKPGEEPAPEQEMKRTLGLVILRGETVVSLSVEGPPPIVDEDKKNAVRLLFPYSFIEYLERSHLFDFVQLFPFSNRTLSTNDLNS